MGNLGNLKRKVKLIEGDDRVRAQKCLQAIHEVLGQYDCVLIPRVTVPVLRPEDINFQVVANSREPNVVEG